MVLQHIDRDFGKSVKLTRVDREMSQEDLAARVKALGYAMSQATVGKIERGERRVTVGEAKAIAQALRVSIDELLRGPSSVSAEQLRSRLRILRNELVDAARAFDSGRAIVAMEALSKSLDKTDVDWLRSLVLESIDDVIDGYRKDNVVANEADRRRDEMDGSSPLERRKIGGLYGEYQERFGDEVPSVIDQHAAAVMWRGSAETARDLDADG